MKKEVKLDEKGYQKLLKKLTSYEKELHELRYGNNQDLKTKVKNWFDDSSIYQTFMKEQRLLKKIDMLKEQLTTSKIIEKTTSDNKVDLDDIIKVDIYTQEEKEEMLVKLVGGIGDFKVEPLEISVNSPLGDAIYQQFIGQLVKYQVGDNIFSVKIKERI